MGAALLAACTSVEGLEDRNNCQRVAAGMTQKQVAEIMGEPDASQTSSDRGEVELSYGPPPMASGPVVIFMRQTPQGTVVEEALCGGAG